MTGWCKAQQYDSVIKNLIHILHRTFDYESWCVSKADLLWADIVEWWYVLWQKQQFCMTCFNKNMFYVHCWGKITTLPTKSVTTLIGGGHWKYLQTSGHLVNMKPQKHPEWCLQLQAKTCTIWISYTIHRDTTQHIFSFLQNIYYRILT